MLRLVGNELAASRVRKWVAAFTAGILWSLPAPAQSPPPPADPVIAAYHEYRTAIARGDLIAAEPAAERAWRTAESSGAQPDRIGALALNLAIARLRLNRPVDAVEPARRALALSEAGAREVDPIAARFVLGEALIASDFNEGERLITQALAGAQSDAYDGAAHSAASALARAAMRRNDFALATTAWESVFRHAAGGPYEPPLSRAEALIGHGTALMSLHKDAEAYGLFVQAGALTAPFAPEREDDNVTIGELFYASALVWSSAAAARMYSNHDPAAPGASFPDRPSLPERPPPCPVRATVSPMPNYPPAAQQRGLIGAVVVRLAVGAAGEVRSYKVLAAVPSDSFAEAINNQRLTWTVTRHPDAPAGCRMESSDTLVQVRFIFP